MKLSTSRGFFLIYYCITACFCLSFLFGCSDTKTAEKKQPQEQKKSASIPVNYKKPPSGYSDTIIISGRSAVFFNADSLQLEKIKAITDTMVFESNLHDCFYQMRNARIVLKKYWPGIHITEASGIRYLAFVKEDKSKIHIDLDSQNDQCGIFLFDPREKPRLADMTNIDTELGFYFTH